MTWYVKQESNGVYDMVSEIRKLSVYDMVSEASEQRGL